MTNPPPRPALKRAADAEIHPARPAMAIPLRSLSNDHGGKSAKTDNDQPKRAATSDTLLTPSKIAEPTTKKSKKGKEKPTKGKAKKLKAAPALELDAALLADLSAKAAAQGYEPEQVVELLVRYWVDN